MIDMPPDLPPPQEVPAAYQARCVAAASRMTGVHPLLINAIIEVEGGKWGTVSRNTNGTYDLGVMQINSSNLPTIQKVYPNITWEALTYKPCINIAVGSWWLANEIKAAGGDVWRGVGNYHSRTPHLHNRYRNRVYAAYKRLRKAYDQLRESFVAR